MNEWKELKIDDLPSDILVGDYDFEFSESGPWHSEDGKALELLEQLLVEDRIKYRYRKRQPKAPSHEEIMNKWWKFSGDWLKVVCYYPGPKTYLFVCSVSNLLYRDEDFINRESADIPPEAAE